MEKSKTLFTLTVTRYNVAASLLLIAICALQPNALPINEWPLSWWFWLTLPVFYALYLFLACIALKCVALFVLSWIDKRSV